MSDSGGRHQQWGPEHAGQIRDELLAGYRRALGWGDRSTAAKSTTVNSTAGNPEGSRVLRVILEGVECAVADRTAVWVPRAAASELRAAAPDSLGGADLVALSETGFLLFDRPICATTLGNGGPLGISPINGVIWWAAAFDGNTFDYCPAEPNVVMVHVLSTTVSPDSPWGPQIWEGSTLSDIGVFLLPVGGHLAGPPASVEDDLTPLIELLFGFGVAACEFGLQASA